MTQSSASTFVQWNLRGLKARSAHLRHLLADSDPLALCLQETHLLPGEAYDLRGYVVHRSDLARPPGGRACGGVAVLVKQHVSHTAIPLNTVLQAVAVRLKVPFEVTLCSLYLPTPNWRSEDLVNLLQQLPAPLMLLGDFNSHNTWWGSERTCPSGTRVEEILSERGDLILLNDGSPTHFNAATGLFSCIDLSVVSASVALAVEWSAAADLYQSDHFPLLLKKDLPGAPPRSIPKWDLSSADWDGFRADFVSPAIDEPVENMVQAFEAAVTDAAASSIPRKGGGVRRRPPVPWWSEDCEVARRAKLRALRRVRRFLSDETLDEFRRLRAAERRIIRNAKRTRWKEYVSTITGATPPKEVWGKMKAIAGRYSTPVSPALRAEGRVLTDPREVANAFASHYELVASSASYSPDFLRVKREAESVPIDLTPSDAGDLNSPFTMRELDKALCRTKDSAPGVDGIPNAMLKHLPTHGKVFLLALYNKIWASGHYPDRWRTAVIVPLLKDGKDGSVTGSYRPISLTCCIGKVLESMANYRLVWYLERNALISPYQAGYRKRHSAIDQLVYLEKIVQDAFLAREHVLGVFFDLEKAFDTTWRYNILRRLSTWGVTGRVLSFVSGFLASRSFRVRVGGYHSDLHQQENGVPQGSVLSTTLFLVAINGLADDLPASVRSTMYVDDLGLFLAGDDMRTMGLTMQTAIDLVVSRAESSGFRFSTAKTVGVHFCRRRKEHENPPLTLRGDRIAFQATVRFLGLIFDSQLRWRAHIDNLVVQCKRVLGVIKVLSSLDWGSDQEVLLRVLNAMLRSRMDYGCVVYGSARKSWLRPLDSLYAQGVRIALGGFRTSCIESLHVAAGVLPLRYRRQQLALSYAEGMRANPDHVLRDVMFGENAMPREYEWLQSRTRPLNVRVEDLYRGPVARVVDEALPGRVPRMPPWTLRTPDVRLDLASRRKRDVSCEEYRVLFLEVLSRYRARRIYYTDGSKTLSGVGCAIHTGDLTRSWPLPATASVYTAELIALQHALEHILSEPTGDAVVCSDSLSALTALQDPFTDDPLMLALFDQLRLVQMSQRRVSFIWLPGHAGISGNEAADLAAKQATEIEVEDPCAVRLDDVKRTTTSKVWANWQAEWDRSTTQLRRIKRNVKSCLVGGAQSRREKSVLTRLCIGHTRLTHGHLLVGERSPRCPHDGEMLTVPHLFEECDAHSALRSRLGLPANIALALSPGGRHVSDVLTFLRSVGYYREI